MNLPIDIPALVTGAIDIEKAKKIPVSVNILIDESASPEFQVFVRSGFNSESANSRVMVGYFPTQPTTVVECDLVVIAAGSSTEIGRIAAEYREAEIPVLVVAESGADVMAAAEAAGNPLPEEDVVCPKVGQPFDEDIKGALADEIGARIARIDAEKRLAFSIAYPFVRRPLALEAVRATSIQNAGIGVVVFIPGADMPIMTANQCKMVLQIAAAYGQPLTVDRVKELAGVLAGAFVCRGIARNVAGVVPAIGWAVKGAVGFAGTQAIGHAAVEYFEAGGNIAGLASVVGKARDTAVETYASVSAQPAYQKAAAVAGPVVRNVAGVALDAVGPVAQSAAKTAFHAARPSGRRKAKRARA